MRERKNERKQVYYILKTGFHIMSKNWSTSIFIFIVEFGMIDHTLVIRD